MSEISQARWAELLEHLEYGSTDVRCEASLTLSELGSPAALEILLDRAGKEGHLGVLECILSSIDGASEAARLRLCEKLQGGMPPAWSFVLLRHGETSDWTLPEEIILQLIGGESIVVRLAASGYAARRHPHLLDISYLNRLAQEVKDSWPDLAESHDPALEAIGQMLGKAAALSEAERLVLGEARPPRVPEHIALLMGAYERIEPLGRKVVQRRDIFAELIDGDYRASEWLKTNLGAKRHEAESTLVDTLDPEEYDRSYACRLIWKRAQELAGIHIEADSRHILLALLEQESALLNENEVEGLRRWLAHGPPGDARPWSPRPEWSHS